MQKKRFLISTVTAAAAIVVLSVVLAVSWLTYGLSSPDAAGRIDTSSTAAEEKDIQTMLQIQPLGVVPSSGVKGFYLSASDLIQKENASGEEISTRAETIAATATSYGFNAVMLETVLGDTVLYALETAPSYPVDAVSLVQAAVKEKGLELYLVFQPGCCLRPQNRSRKKKSVIWYSSISRMGSCWRTIMRPLTAKAMPNIWKQAAAVHMRNG